MSDYQGRWYARPPNGRITERRVTSLAYYLGHRGSRALRADDMVRAQAWLDSADRLKPGYVPTRYWRGVLEKKRGNLDAAALLLRDAAAEADSLDYRAAAMVDLAEVQSLAGEHEQAMDTARRAIAIQAMGNNTEWTRWHQSRAYHALGCDAARNGDLDEALRCHREAVRLAPDSPGRLVSLSVTHRKRDEKPEAIACLRKAAELAPDDVDIAYRLALQHARCDQPAAAAGLYLRAIELDPDHAESHHGLGCVLLKLGHREEAERQLREAIRLAPEEPATQANLGIVLNARCGHRRAARWLRQVIRDHPDCALAHAHLGYVLWGHASPKTVRAEFEKAIALGDEEVAGKARAWLANYEEAP